VASDKVISFAAAAEFRDTVQAYANAGWHVDGANLLADVAGGAAVYLIDVVAARMILVGLKRGALDELAAVAARHALSFAEICNHFGTLFTNVVVGRTRLVGEAKNDLAAAAGIYIIGTQSYTAGMPLMTLPQFLVLRLPNEETGGHYLRPVPLIKATPMSPEELVDVTNNTLAHDRARHPARFGRGQLLPFRLKT
jgi:hypothetical protein